MILFDSRPIQTERKQTPDFPFRCPLKFSQRFSRFSCLRLYLHVPPVTLASTFLIKYLLTRIPCIVHMPQHSSWCILLTLHLTRNDKLSHYIAFRRGHGSTKGSWRPVIVRGTLASSLSLISSAHHLLKIPLAVYVTNWFKNKWTG